ncbi:MAG: hypothetical protein K9H16_01845 [Bacteroidales bacterium]|nr:hypothetical protein [Bacteroidales bacterium]
MMVHQTISYRNLFVISIVAVFFTWGFSSCYNDNEEDLYPGTIACDTTNITYAGTVAPILQINCNGCHNTVVQQSGIITDNYSDLQTIINNGSFKGAINHLGGFSPMPKDGGKLSDCDLKQINIWLDSGSPNN